VGEQVAVSKVIWGRVELVAGYRSSASPPLQLSVVIAEALAPAPKLVKL